MSIESPHVARWGNRDLPRCTCGINGRPRGDTQLMFFRMRSTFVGALGAHHSLRSCGIGIAHGRSEECPHRRLPRSRTFGVHQFCGI
jgi:hypothetical protein